ncbi:MAG: HAMP domain-containing histidine kinase [Sporomusaceae bacterium]|nr:HAMP domain-containing histidine kinase [Sporomusaceae bacterium]
MEGLTIAIGILIFIVCLLILYIALLQWQVRSINRQLGKRLTGNTRQPVSLELINGELNQLTANINKCLKAEETLRLESVREEKRFKELIANISHDLRTPLTAIKGYQQLMGKGELTAEQQKKLQIAQKYAEELGCLIEQFFEYSYLVNADLKLNLERINLTNLVTECLATSIPAFEKRGIMVQFAETSPIFVLADQGMTVRIVQNLIRNCVAHSAGNVVVSLSASEKAFISFKNPVENDNEIDVKRMFDRFYTGDRARSKTTGLGLSIVKLLAEQMGGVVSAGLQENELVIEVELPFIGI